MICFLHGLIYWLFPAAARSSNGFISFISITCSHIGWSAPLFVHVTYLRLRFCQCKSYYQIAFYDSLDLCRLMNVILVLHWLDIPMYAGMNYSLKLQHQALHGKYFLAIPGDPHMTSICLRQVVLSPPRASFRLELPHFNFLALSVAWWIFILFSKGELQAARPSIGFIFLLISELCINSSSTSAT